VAYGPRKNPLDFGDNPGMLETRPGANSRASIQHSYVHFIAICDFRLKSPFIAETIQDRPIVAMER